MKINCASALEDSDIRAHSAINCARLCGIGRLIPGVNTDEYLDLVCHLESDEGRWSPDSGEEASVVSRLIDGRPISGTDSICTVPYARIALKDTDRKPRHWARFFA